MEGKRVVGKFMQKILETQKPSNKYIKQSDKSYTSSIFMITKHPSPNNSPINLNINLQQDFFQVSQPEE